MEDAKISSNVRMMTMTHDRRSPEFESVSSHQKDRPKNRPSGWDYDSGRHGDLRTKTSKSRTKGGSYDRVEVKREKTRSPPGGDTTEEYDEEEDERYGDDTVAASE